MEENSVNKNARRTKERKKTLKILNTLIKICKSKLLIIVSSRELAGIAEYKQKFQNKSDANESNDNRNIYLESDFFLLTKKI